MNTWECLKISLLVLVLTSVERNKICFSDIFLSVCLRNSTNTVGFKLWYGPWQKRCFFLCFVVVVLVSAFFFFFHLLVFNWLDKSTEFYVVVRSQHSLWWATHLFLLRDSEYLGRDVLTVGDGSCQRTVRLPLKRDVETQVVPFGCDTSSWISITVFVFAVSR